MNSKNIYNKINNELQTNIWNTDFKMNYFKKGVLSSGFIMIKLDVLIVLKIKLKFCNNIKPKC